MSEKETKEQRKIEDHPLLNIDLLEKELAAQETRLKELEKTDDSTKSRTDYWNCFEAIQGLKRLLSYVRQLNANQEEFEKLKADPKKLEWKLRFNLMNQTG